MGKACQFSMRKYIFQTCVWALFLQIFLSGNTFRHGVSASKLETKANDPVVTAEVAATNNAETPVGIHSAIDAVAINADDGPNCDKIKYLGCVGGKKIYYDPALRLNWFEAWEYCRSIGLHLLSVDTTYEYKYIRKNMPALFRAVNNAYFWTSGNDLGNEGIFSWMASGRPFGFDRFSPGQPDNFGGNENCVWLWPQENGTNYLNDGTCHLEAYPICQRVDKEINEVS